MAVAWVKERVARLRELRARPKAWLKYVLGLLLAAALVVFVGRPLLFRNVTLSPVMETLSLEGVPELAASASADFVLSSRLLKRVTGLSIVGGNEIKDHSWLALSVPADATPPCSQLDFVPGVNAGGATLTIVPRGASGCALSVQSTQARSTQKRKPDQVLKENQQLLLALRDMKVGKNGATVRLFEASTAGALSGRLATPLTFLGEVQEGKCSGKQLTRLSAPALSLREVYLDTTGGQPTLRADLLLDYVSALKIGDDDCRYEVFHQLARKSVLKQVGELVASGLLGLFVGLVLARKWGS